MSTLAPTNPLEHKYVVHRNAARGPTSRNNLPYTRSRTREVGDMKAMARGKAAVLPLNPVVAEVKSAMVVGRARL